MNDNSGKYNTKYNVLIAALKICNVLMRSSEGNRHSLTNLINLITNLCLHVTLLKYILTSLRLHYLICLMFEERDNTAAFFTPSHFN